MCKLAEGQRFFLSENECAFSCSVEHRDSYYFYLVSFDGKGEPESLQPVLAADIYTHAEITPASYTVRFDISHALDKK